ncbi:Rha family transcriptional regulator [Psychrobacillus sp. FSL K6-1267]|uniref:Rha family transcriptional regulator n=1 Tax=Psychrobacillus sp. FSL K6-1267 TaxID=2921543 RepID=UPI0030FD12B3
MCQLKVLSIDGQLVTDSREVAEMTGKEHKELMRSIRQYSSVLTSANLRSSEFFIPHYYKDAKKEQRPCFLLTKKGCDMVANKMTGERGILFTAEYVTRFDEMEKEIRKPKVLSEKEQLKASLKLSLETSEDVEVLKVEVMDLKAKVENQITIDHGEQRRLQKAVAIKVYELESLSELRPKMFREIYREIKDRFGVASYKDVKRKDLQMAIRYIEAWIPRRAA